MTAAARLSWVDIAKGLSIFLVVMYHSTLGVGDALGEPGFMHYILAFATPFRMPEFFLISGLFLSAVIARPWPQFADRRVLHYFYFYILWAVIQIVVKVGLGSRDPVSAVEQIAWATIQPYGVLWFIYMLAIFGIVAKLAWQFRAPHWLILGLAAALQIAPINTPSYAINQFAEYFVFFYAGYAAAPFLFSITERVQAKPLLGLMGLGAWAVINFLLVFSPGFELSPAHVQLGLADLPGLRLVLAFTGSIAVCVAAALLAKTALAGLLGFIGEKSIVIYLSFVIPMAVARTILVKLGFISDAGLMSLLVIIASFVAPLILMWLIQKTGFGKFLFTRPDWASLPSVRKPKMPKGAEAAE